MRKKAEKKRRVIFPKIEFPQEVRFLGELNKFREEEYRKWLLKKVATERVVGKSTLIIGARCKDGIILGGDTKVIRGGEIEFEKKIKTFQIREGVPVIFAASGIVGVIDDFLEMFQATLTENITKGTISSLLSIKFIAEDLVKDIEARYAPRLLTSPINFIFGGLSNLTDGQARLYEIGSPGFGQKIKYFSLVGHGAPYARTIAKYLFPRQGSTDEIPLQCSEIVHRIATCISWIGEKGEIDDYVGGDLQIVYILDDKPEIKEGEYDKKKILNKVARLKNNLIKINF